MTARFKQTRKPLLQGNSSSGCAPSGSRLGPVRGRLAAGGITSPGRRGVADARNATAVEAGNAPFWSADETSGDSAVGLAPGRRWRRGHLRQVGERTPRGRNSRWCCCAAWRLAADATAVPDRQGKHGSTAVQRDRCSAFMIRHSINRHRVAGASHCWARHAVRPHINRGANAFLGNGFQRRIQRMPNKLSPLASHPSLSGVTRFQSPN